MVVELHTYACSSSSAARSCRRRRRRRPAWRSIRCSSRCRSWCPARPCGKRRCRRRSRRIRRAGWRAQPPCGSDRARGDRLAGAGAAGRGCRPADAAAGRRAADAVDAVAAVALGSGGAELAEALEPTGAAVADVPGEQSASLAQARAVPVVALQANGTQDCVEAGLQMPAPSQRARRAWRSSRPPGRRLRRTGCRRRRAGRRRCRCRSRSFHSWRPPARCTGRRDRCRWPGPASRSRRLPASAQDMQVPCTRSRSRFPGRRWCSCTRCRWSRRRRSV